jgi:hypothetical protein
MKYHNLFLAMGLFMVPHFAFGACSTANLTRCLDSVCAINIGANPAARCQYCGSESAGTPSTAGVMKTVTAGSAAKYTISEKELKKAPTDPGQRYIWATEQCLKKLKDCTSEDVSDNYDSLIEQSCKAAGISADMATLAKKVSQEKKQPACSSEISSCLIADKRCLADYRNCESDADFDKYFSECSIAATGCDSYISAIRSTLISARDAAIKNSALALKNIVEAYQTARKQKLAGTKQSCKDNSAKQNCIKTVCANNMKHKCDDGFEYETTLAGQLCAFYDVACDRLN